jgi:hypothetical protein
VLPRTRDPEASDAPCHERRDDATIAITFDTYSHAVPAMQEEAAALIAGLVLAGE